MVWICNMDSSGLGYDLLVGCYQHGNLVSTSIKGDEFVFKYKSLIELYKLTVKNCQDK